MATERDTKGQKKINEAQQKINEGQRNINGALCYVDWHVLKALHALTSALQNAGVLTETQLSEAKKELKLAYYASKEVASIDPPGCGTNYKVLPQPQEPGSTAAPQEPDSLAA